MSKALLQIMLPDVEDKELDALVGMVHDYLEGVPGEQRPTFTINKIEQRSETVPAKE